jgi:hypothetical protein
MTRQIVEQQIEQIREFSAAIADAGSAMLAEYDAKAADGYQAKPIVAKGEFCFLAEMILSHADGNWDSLEWARGLTPATTLAAEIANQNEILNAMEIACGM